MMGPNQIMLWIVALIALELYHLKWIWWEFWECRKCGVRNKDCGCSSKWINYL